MSDIPEVECIWCERKVRCIRVSDGTVYRPLAWTFNPEHHPLLGVCTDCQVKQQAAQFLELATAMHVADPTKPTEDIIDEATDAVLDRNRRNA